MNGFTKRLALIVAFCLCIVPALALQPSTQPGAAHEAVLAPAIHRTGEAFAPVSWSPLAKGAVLVGLTLGLLLVGTVITQVQPTNQRQCKFSYIATVTMAAGDGPAVIPHGLGVAPLMVFITPQLQGTALPFGAMTVAWDATNVTVTKPTAVNNEFNFTVWALVPNSLLL